MRLDWLAPIRLSAGDYEAWVAPSAGGRLCRLLWHGPRGAHELLVPADTSVSFDEDDWPKQGAFPMLPYANRLAGARLHWQGREHRVRAAPGQWHGSHGLHGFGHRQIWQVTERSAHHVLMSYTHPEASDEWPWAFTAQLAYTLSAHGLDVSLALRNDATTSMPVVLGWHPYVPLPAAGEPAATAAVVHEVTADGLRKPSQTVADTRTPHTLALEGWGGRWTLPLAGNDALHLTSDAAHLVHHVPGNATYVCAEPVTALPGGLGSGAEPATQEALALVPAAWRRLTCRLGAD